MTTQYTPILQLALPVTGELNGTWGDVVNDNITSMVEQAIAGMATISTWTANAHTLTTANGTTDEARCAMLVLQTGSGGTALSATGQVICPAESKLYVVKNDAAYAVTVKTSGGSGVAVASGDTAFVFCDGTNVNACVTQIINGHITGNLTVDGNTTLGDSSADTVVINAGSTTLNDGGAIRFEDNTGGEYVALKAPATIAASFTLTLPIDDGTNGQALITDGSGNLSWSTAASGDVYGPASATDNAVSRFDGTTGKLIQNSVVTIGDTGDVAGVGALSMSGAITLSGGTANGVLYLNGSKVVTSGSALYFDGTYFAIGNTVISRLAIKQQVATTAGGLGIEAYADGSRAYFYSDGSTWVNENSVGVSGSYLPFSWKLAGTENMRLTSTGLGIGTSSPISKLQSVSAISALTSNAGFSSLPLTVSDSTALAADTGGGINFNAVITAGGAYNSIAAIKAGRTIATGYDYNGYLSFYTGSNATGYPVERMRLDSSGNLGLGVTPSAWFASCKAFQFGTSGSLEGRSDSTSVALGSNFYINTSASLIYSTTAAAARYQLANGAHYWYNAPSGTAGSAITFTQAMTLDASGNLWQNVNSTVTSAYHKFGDTSTAYAQIGGYYDSATTGHLEIYTLRAGTPTEAVRVLDSGYVGINTTTPSTNLNVSGGAVVNGVSPNQSTMGISGAVAASPVALSVYPSDYTNSTSTGVSLIGVASSISGVSTSTGTVITQAAYFAAAIGSTVAGNANLGNGLTSGAVRASASDVGTNIAMTGVVANIRQMSTINSSAVSTSATALTANSQYQTGSVTTSYGLNVVGQFGAVANFTAAITTHYGIYTSTNVGATSGTGTGTVTTYYDAYLAGPTLRTTGTVTNNWGLYQANTSAKNYFGGKVGIGSTAPTSALQVVGLPVYANNAAAIAGGLTAGAFYRTGADPDPVCVVH